MTHTGRSILGLLTVLVLAAGHVAYHYLPRARLATPGGDPQIARLLASEEFPMAVWMPYPHQNLAHLRRDAGLDEASLRSAARLAGLPTPGLPAFGPLAVPPASEIAAASDEPGERFAIFARVYPAFAAFAKLAGHLAGNPWLKGGEASHEGRSVDVAWRGNLWTVTSAGFPRLETPPPAPGDPALAMIAVRQALDPLPAGRYRLAPAAGSLEVTSEAPVPEDPRFDAATLTTDGVFLLTFTGRRQPLGETAKALAVFSQGTAKDTDLPRVATLFEPGGERWSLPGESLLELIGSDLQRASEPPWEIAALGSRGLDGARRLAPRLAPLVEEAPLAWGVWLDLEGARSEVARIVGQLDGVPIVPRGRLERWRDVEQVLRPLARRYERLSLVVTEEPRALRLRVEARPEGESRPAPPTP